MAVPRAIAGRQPVNLFESTMIFTPSAEISICFKCTLPASKCNGECKRFREEMKKIKLDNKAKGKTK